MVKDRISPKNSTISKFRAALMVMTMDHLRRFSTTKVRDGDGFTRGERAVSTIFEVKILDDKRGELDGPKMSGWLFWHGNDPRKQGKKRVMGRR